MANNGKKGGGYKPSPTVPHFNEDVRNNQILAAFNKLESDGARMEIKDMFNASGKYPTVIPNMNGKGSKKSNGGK
jgi:hypothetical protein